MPVKLYKQDFSPPSRAAMMGCEIFNVPTEFVNVNLMTGDHKTPEFLKKNPVHTIPVLEDGDLILHDSHAILSYLADKYGKDDSWYPKDLNKRALVNQKLYFVAAVLFTRIRNVTYPALALGVRKPTQMLLDDIQHAYDFLEDFLTRNKFLAADHITIADVAALANTTSLAHLVPIDPAKEVSNFTDSPLSPYPAEHYVALRGERGLRARENAVREKLMDSVAPYFYRSFTYPKTTAWIRELEKQPFAQKHNAPGNKGFGGMIRQTVDL